MYKIHKNDNFKEIFIKVIKQFNLKKSVPMINANETI